MGLRRHCSALGMLADVTVIQLLLLENSLRPGRTCPAPTPSCIQQQRDWTWTVLISLDPYPARKKILKFIEIILCFVVNKGFLLTPMDSEYLFFFIKS